MPTREQLIAALQTRQVRAREAYRYALIALALSSVSLAVSIVGFFT